MKRLQVFLDSKNYVYVSGTEKKVIKVTLKFE